jgi:predicted DsbA family dithiol-disulfide isomerase
MPRSGGPDKACGALVARSGVAREIEHPRRGGATVRNRKLVVFADYACPFCYLAESEVARLRAERAVEIEGAALELRPAGTGLPSPQVGWMREAWQESVEPLAAELGVEMRYPSLTTRTRKAHEAAAFARERGSFDVMNEAIYRAYWRDGRDIGRIDVLVDIGAEAGLDPMDLRVELDIDKWAERVDRDAVWAALLGVTGVPAYLLYVPGAEGQPAESGQLRAGMQRYDELKAWVVRDDV